MTSAPAARGRRVALVLAATALVLPVPPATAQEAETRWVAYVRAEEPFLPGSLHLVESTGRGARTLARRGIITADLGPGTSAFAVRQEEGRPASVVRISGRGRRETVLAPDRETLYLSLAAGPGGEVAVLRFVPSGTQAPPFLRGAVSILASTGVPVITPPRRPRGPVRLRTVAEAGPEFYELRFTNDPRGERAHAEQFNLFVSGQGELADEPPPDSTTVDVRGTTGWFFCGASACFLTWQESETQYTAGEFGGPEDAVAFADDLAPMEEVAGPEWRLGGDFQVPQLVARPDEGEEVILESVEGFCECGFQPADWDDRAERVLVLEGAEGFSQLSEYPAAGGDPKVLLEGESGRMPIDAAYGPQGIMVLTAEFAALGSPGTLRTLDGDVLADDVRAFDVEGTTMAYVDEEGRVIVRNLRNGRERTVGRGAVDVSVSPDLVPVARPSPVPEEGTAGVSPLLLGVVAALGALALLGGGVLLGMRQRRR